MALPSELLYRFALPPSEYLLPFNLVKHEKISFLPAELTSLKGSWKRTTIYFASLKCPATICTNYEVDYGYRTVLKIAGILISLATLIALFFNNNQRFYTQYTTIGLALIITGTFILFNSTNLLRLISSFLFLLFGNIFYLKELHKQYMWND